jgi:hypothetical protein
LTIQAESLYSSNLREAEPNICANSLPPSTSGGFKTLEVLGWTVQVDLLMAIRGYGILKGTVVLGTSPENCLKFNKKLKKFAACCAFRERKIVLDIKL